MVIETKRPKRQLGSIRKKLGFFLKTIADKLIERFIEAFFDYAFVI